MTATTHPTVVRVAAALAAADAMGSVVELADPAPTALTAAAQLGCEVGAIANSLVFDADGAPLLVLTSGAHRVNTAALAKRLGMTKLRRADPEFVRAHTGMPIGGVAPVGHPARMRTLVDTALERHPTVWAAAGHPNCVFPTSYNELLRIADAEPADVSD